MSAPSTILHNTSNRVECTICSHIIGDLRTDGSVEAGVYLPCSHFFGMRCLAHSLIDRQNCPICRTELPRHILMDLLRVEHALDGSATGDMPTEGGRTWRELDAEETARDIGVLRLRAEGVLGIGPPLSSGSRRGGGSFVFPTPPFGGGRHERATIIVRDLDERGDIVESEADINGFLTGGPNAQPSGPPTRGIQFRNPFPGEVRETSGLSDFSANRERQFRQRDFAAAELHMPAQSSPHFPVYLSRHSGGAGSRGLQEQYGRPPASVGRRNALPGYSSPSRRRSPPPIMRRSILPPPLSRYDSREESTASVNSGYSPSRDRGSPLYSGGSGYCHVQPNIYRNGVGTEIIVVERDFSTMRLSEREHINRARGGTICGGYGRDNDDDRQARMDRALNDPDYFRRSNRYLSRRGGEDSCRRGY
jgi:hypothetical protein